jgi:hypothetical protein
MSGDKIAPEIARITIAQSAVSRAMKARPKGKIRGPVTIQHLTCGLGPMLQLPTFNPWKGQLSLLDAVSECRSHYLMLFRMRSDVAARTPPICFVRAAISAQLLLEDYAGRESDGVTSLIPHTC